MNRISVATGTEGPRYDPYAFTETRLEARGCVVTIHAGLKEEVTIARGKHAQTFSLYSGAERLLADCAVQRAVGLSMLQIERVARKAAAVPLRLHKAHGGTDWVAGFPGEHLLQCRCGAIIDYHFNIGAII